MHNEEAFEDGGVGVGIGFCGQKGKHGQYLEYRGLSGCGRMRMGKILSDRNIYAYLQQCRNKITSNSAG